MWAARFYLPEFNKVDVFEKKKRNNNYIYIIKREFE